MQQKELGLLVEMGSGGEIQGGRKGYHCCVCELSGRPKKITEAKYSLRIISYKVTERSKSFRLE
jgi:hypothetical protein